MGKIKQNNIEVTKVIFRKFTDGDVIALFPELPGSNKVSECMSYAHLGQHSQATTALYYDTKPCRVGEYFSLFKELESIGYNLKVVTRISYEMDQKRIKALKH